MRVRRGNAALAIALSIAISLIPAGASSAGGASVSASMSVDKVGERAGYGIYSLTVNVHSPAGLSVMTSVVSYDRGVVVPVSRSGWTDIPGLISGGSLGALESLLEDRSGSSYGMLGFWFQGDLRDGFLCDLYSTAPLTSMASSKPVYAFYFRLADGGAEEDLSQDTFRIETDKSEGSLLATIYKTPDALADATGLGITDKSPGGDITHRYSSQGEDSGAGIGVSHLLLVPESPPPPTSNGGAGSSPPGTGGPAAPPAGQGGDPSAQGGDSSASLQFVDVSPTDWYYNAVTFLVENGITQGTSPTTFSPSAPITRGQLLVLVMRAYGIEPDAQTRDNFADAGDTYYTLYLSAAKRLGIVDGVGDNRFEPERACTRQEMFKLVYGALSVMGKLPTAAGVKSLDDFADKTDVADWAQESAGLLVSAGIISGTGEGMLQPLATSSRAEMAQILMNLLHK